MRTILFILTLTLSIGSVTSCKTKKAASSTTASVTTSTSGSSSTSVSTMSNNSTAADQGNNQGAYIGKVSHKYRDGGCSTVIIIKGEAGDITLIPKDKLKDDVDVDGQLIKFDYRALKMPQPAGCTVGVPAEITNINKMK